MPHDEEAFEFLRKAKQKRKNRPVSGMKMYGSRMNLKKSQESGAGRVTQSRKQLSAGEDTSQMRTKSPGGVTFKPSGAKSSVDMDARRQAFRENLDLSEPRRVAMMRRLAANRKK